MVEDNRQRQNEISIEMAKLEWKDISKYIIDTDSECKKLKKLNN